MNLYLLWVILGVMQGVFEWLPVSSEGQIVLFLLAIHEQNVNQAISYAIWLHIGTFFAVLLYYRHELYFLFKANHVKTKATRILLVWSTIGTALTALPLYLLMSDFPSSYGLFFMLLIAISLFITGWLISKWELEDPHSSTNDPTLPSSRVTAFKEINDFTPRESFFLGLVQGFAIIPGISRSGSTVSYLLFRQFKPQDSFNASFLISIPAVAGAVFIDSLKFYLNPPSGSFPFLPVLLGVLTAFIVGYLSLDVLLRLARKIRFSWFCYIIGAFTLVFVGFQLFFL